jgi:PIN domain nuclease of toxin-antitoxin system
MLDTHALVWALQASPRLSKAARRIVEDGANEVLVSAASAIEIAIKTALGRLRAPDDLVEACDEAGFVRRPIGFAEAKRLASLPRLHRDPFDRLLVAHALQEGAVLLTCDSQIAMYPVRTAW